MVDTFGGLFKTRKPRSNLTGPTGVLSLNPSPTVSVMFDGLISRTLWNRLPVSENTAPPIGPHNGNLSSLFMTSTAFPPSGLLIRTGVPSECFTMLPFESRCGTRICGPASSKPKPRRSLAPPAKNRSEIGIEFFPPNGAARPSFAENENTVSRNFGIG